MRDMLLQKNSQWYMLMSLVLAVSFFVASSAHVLMPTRAHVHAGSAYTRTTTSTGLPVCPTESMSLQNLYMLTSSCATESGVAAFKIAGGVLLALFLSRVCYQRLCAYWRQFQNARHNFAFGKQWARWFIVLEKRDPIFA